ncbi:MAG: flagellar basal body protein [Tepidisphaeraceae bacterium]|jgi:flagellar hook protein FlgE
MDVFSVALSGMQAAQQMLQTASNNIANLNTPGFQAQQLDLDDDSTDVDDASEISGVDEDDPDMNSLEDSDASDVGDESLESQIVDLRQAAFLYDSNAMVIRAQNQMIGSLVNVLDRDNDDDSGD